MFVDSATKVTPDRSLEQRMEALARGNEIRSKRATLKRDLKAGRVSIVALLANPPEYALTMKAFDLLVAVPKWGRVKASHALNQCRVSHSKTLGGMTERQRAELVGMLAPTRRAEREDSGEMRREVLSAMAGLPDHSTANTIAWAMAGSHRALPIGLRLHWLGVDGLVEMTWVDRQRTWTLTPAGRQAAPTAA